MKTIIHKTVFCLKSKLNLFKRVVAGCSLLLLLPAAQAQFTWPVYEPFGEYDEDSGLGQNNTSSTSNFWYIGNSAGTSNPRVRTAAALSHPALVADTNSIPKGVISASVTGSHDGGAPFTGQTNKTIYVSFLINNIFNAGGLNADRMFFNLSDNAGSATAFRTSAYLTPDYRIKIIKNQSSGSGLLSGPTPVLSTNGTHLVVMRYLKVPGDNDRVDLWLDPTPFGDDASIPPPTISTTNGANVGSFTLMALSSRGTGLYTYFMDEIRLGDTWASVTPLATPAPGPLFSVTGGGAGCPGDIISVGLSGSVTTNTYLLYTNGIYSEVSLAGNGSALDFGQQTALGYYAVLASNTITGNLGWMSNSVSISILQPAVIVTEPTPVITATNNRAAFTTVLTGDALVYQWYRDGTVLTNDSHISGSATPGLVIFPATTADIGGYYCIITNSCGSSATTTTNSLTLDAPNNLVWTGDGFNINVWDVATTAEFNGGSAVFNPGDNVTFDDTYTYANAVSLNGVLTPTIITVNASRAYTWAGSGTITGDGMLVKSGTGRLSISNSVVNTYSGGTIISNGTVHVRVSLSNLGTGPVTLAGGTLETEETQTLPNNIFVTANSALQIDKSGGSALALSGTLDGSSGTSLSITNFNIATNTINRLSLSGVFTNNTAIVLSTYTNAIGLELAPNNSSGVQVYNGAISSTGVYTVGLFTKVGAGAVYLNAANTYNGPTTNSAGLLAGSGSITGPLVVGASGTLGAGSANAIGTFTVNGNIILNGKVFIRVDKSLAQSNDLVSVTGTITNGGVGTVTVTNIGATALAVGDSFRIFSGAVSNGAALTVTGGGMNWANNLAVDGSIQIIPAVAGYPTNISYVVSGGSGTLTWPATHLGWILQSQTNSLSIGLSNAWYDIPNTENVTSTNIPVNPENPTVFYRLRHP